MIDDLEDQLRRYGDALEEHLSAPNVAVMAVARPSRRRFLVPITAAAALLLIVVGVAVLDDDSSTVPVTADEREDLPGPTTSTTATTEPGMTPTTTSGASAETPTTTSVTPAESPVTGSVAWAGRDARATLAVAACRAADTTRGCPAAITVPVGDDGAFEITLPDGTWNVVAYVAAQRSCIFNCSWPDAPLDAVRSNVATVTSGTTSNEPLSFTVSARVVDVFVRDRNDKPFDGGGVQATDARCNGMATCPEVQTPEFVGASAADGAVRLVLDTTVTYVLHGQATNTGWPDPAWTNEGNTFWFSPDETMRGDALDEGHVFRVDGAPAEPS